MIDCKSNSRTSCY